MVEYVNAVCDSTGTGIIYLLDVGVALKGSGYAFRLPVQTIETNSFGRIYSVTQAVRLYGDSTLGGTIVAVPSLTGTGSYRCYVTISGHMVNQ